MPEAEFRDWLTYLSREPDLAARLDGWMAQLVAAVYAVPFLSHGRPSPVKAESLVPDPWADVAPRGGLDGLVAWFRAAGERAAGGLSGG